MLIPQRLALAPSGISYRSAPSVRAHNPYGTSPSGGFVKMIFVPPTFGLFVWVRVLNRPGNVVMVAVVTRKG